MVTVWRVHSQDPQQRYIKQAAAVLVNGGLVVCPTECSYVLLHGINAKHAHDRVLEIRELPKEHLFTLLCNSLGELAKYAQVGTTEHRIMRKHCPGPYTFVLPVTRLVPKRLSGPKRKTIGVRISDHPVCRALLDEIAEPVITTTARVAGDSHLSVDRGEIVEIFGPLVDGILLLDEGNIGETTIVNLVNDPPLVLRQGRGAVETLGI